LGKLFQIREFGKLKGEKAEVLKVFKVLDPVFVGFTLEE
jgi:hypothetical protein